MNESFKLFCRAKEARKTVRVEDPLILRPGKKKQQPKREADEKINGRRGKIYYA